MSALCGDLCIFCCHCDCRHDAGLEPPLEFKKCLDLTSATSPNLTAYFLKSFLSLDMLYIM